jgi:hypothetical protein
MAWKLGTVTCQIYGKVSVAGVIRSLEYQHKKRRNDNTLFSKEMNDFSDINESLLSKRCFGEQSVA